MKLNPLILTYILISGEKSYNKKLKEDRYKGYDPRPESLRPTNEKVQEEIHEFLIRCHDKKNTDKKTEKRIHSNFYCLYATMDLDGPEEIEEAVLSPIEQKIKENWDVIESKFKDYLLDPFDLEEEARAELFEEIKILFIENLKESQNRFSNDPLNTDMGVHVTGSEPQSASKSWKKERYHL